VGLATVAGIQAFDENQAQASQDALTAKGTSIASDIKGLEAKPVQLGGIDLSASADADKIANKLGYEGKTVDAPGAGQTGECTIGTGTGTATITCDSDDSPQTVTVTFDPSKADGEQVSTTFSSSSGGGDGDA
jgi:hypothetical protein